MDALTGEMNRRQEVLRQAGNVDGIAAYRRARRDGAQLSPLPTLFIIVDEFSELLRQHPDFADMFVAIGRLGRSLGVHLLLASQRLEEGRLRGLESHLSYRVCLKTLSINESRIVLGTSDAYELPSAPGAAYLRVGADGLIQFQTAYVSGPCRADAQHAAGEPISPERAENSAPARLFATRADRAGHHCRPHRDGCGQSPHRPPDRRRAAVRTWPAGARSVAAAARSGTGPEHPAGRR